MLASEKAEDNCVSAFWSSWLVKARIPKRCAVARASSCQATWRESPRWRPRRAASVSAQTCDQRCPPRLGRLRVTASAR